MEKTSLTLSPRFSLRAKLNPLLRLFYNATGSIVLAAHELHKPLEIKPAQRSTMQTMLKIERRNPQAVLKALHRVESFNEEMIVDNFRTKGTCLECSRPFDLNLDSPNQITLSEKRERYLETLKNAGIALEKQDFMAAINYEIIDRNKFHEFLDQCATAKLNLNNDIVFGNIIYEDLQTLRNAIWNLKGSDSNEQYNGQTLNEVIKDRLTILIKLNELGVKEINNEYTDEPLDIQTLINLLNNASDVNLEKFNRYLDS